MDIVATFRNRKTKLVGIPVADRRKFLREFKNRYWCNGCIDSDGYIVLADDQIYNLEEFITCFYRYQKFDFNALYWHDDI